MCFIFGSLDKSYTEKGSSILARLIPNLNDSLFWRFSAAASPNHPMPASSVEASGVSSDPITKSFQTVTLLEAWLLMGSFGRCCRGEIGGEALQDVRVDA